MTRRPRTLLLCSVVGAAAISLPACTSPTSNSLDAFAGTWVSESDGRIVEETWMTPRAAGTVGVNRSVDDRGRVGFEWLRIAPDERGLLTYYASPMGREATPFTLETWYSGPTDDRGRVSRWTFVNAENDFPQRIVYEFGPENRLVASIRGEIDGEPRSMSWSFRRR